MYVKSVVSMDPSSPDSHRASLLMTELHKMLYAKEIHNISSFQKSCFPAIHGAYFFEGAPIAVGVTGCILFCSWNPGINAGAKDIRQTALSLSFMHYTHNFGWRLWMTPFNNGHIAFCPEIGTGTLVDEYLRCSFGGNSIFPIFNKKRNSKSCTMFAIISLVPVLLFLGLLYLIDSFKLVRVSSLLSVFLLGGVCALVSYFFNTLFQSAFPSGFDFYARYIAPVIEESLKALVVLQLIARKKTGFLIDAGIYGFAVGAGFSFVENIYYLLQIHDTNVLTWLVRGLGTAIMHGACTTLLAIFCMGALQAGKKMGAGLWVGLGVAILIHAGYNHFFIEPVLQTLFIALLTPTALYIVFRINEKQLQSWLEVELFNEISILGMIRKGIFRESKSGKYLASLNEYFPREAIVDMYCYIGLFLELSVIAKRNLLLAENEFPIPSDPDLDNKLKELDQLRKSIGKTGELAIAPLIRMNYRDLWKLSTLK